MSEDNYIEDFNDIFAQRKRLVQFAHSYLHDLAMSEDVVMDAYMYYWENRQRIQDSGNVWAYMLLVVKHKCLDSLKQKASREQAHDKMLSDAMWELNMDIATLEAFDPYEIFTDEFRAFVRAALAKLPSNTRRIFLMSRRDNRTYAEIAEELGVSKKTVEFHMSRALRILRDEFSEWYPMVLLLLAMGASIE